VRFVTSKSLLWYAARFTTVCGASISIALATDPTQIPAPSDATANVPPTSYQSVLSGKKGRYVANTDVDRLSWRHLFLPDGQFATSPPTAAKAMHKPSTNPAKSRSMSSAAQIQSSPLTASSASDARGIIKSIYVERGRVKLKHGPIDKFDMPGMTMIFRIRDPHLFDQIKTGDEVGVTIEMDRGAMYITGFQK
jgi:Cu(I)/Ag(I) efflux system protein CusF